MRELALIPLIATALRIEIALLGSVSRRDYLFGGFVLATTVLAVLFYFVGLFGRGLGFGLLVFGWLRMLALLFGAGEILDLSLFDFVHSTNNMIGSHCPTDFRIFGVDILTSRYFMELYNKTNDMAYRAVSRNPRGALIGMVALTQPW